MDRAGERVAAMPTTTGGAEGEVVAALRAELASLRRVMEDNDRELVKLVVSLAGEVTNNRAMISSLLGETPEPLADAPAHDFWKLVTERPRGLAV